MTILVSGATGNNGKEIVKQLAALGAPVRALVRDRAKAGALEGPGVELAEGDFTDPDSLVAALRGVDRALMLPPVVEDAVELQRNFVNAAKQAGVPHVVKFSVAGADPQSPVRFARWHGQGEQLLKDSGLAWTMLEPNSFMQNMLQFAATIKSDGVFYQPGADGRVSHIDIRDIAASAAAILTGEGHAGKTYVLTGPEALTFGEIAEKMSAALGRTITYVDVSPEQFKQTMVGYGTPEWMADGMNELYAIYRAGYAAAVSPGVQDLTGRPPHTFDDFARDYAGAFK